MDFIYDALGWVCVAIVVNSFGAWGDRAMKKASRLTDQTRSCKAVCVASRSCLV